MAEAERPLQKDVRGLDKEFNFEKHLRGTVKVDGKSVKAHVFYRDMLDGIANVLKAIYGDSEERFVGETLETMWFHALQGFDPLLKYLKTRATGTSGPSPREMELALWSFSFFTVGLRNNRLAAEGLLDD